MHRSTCLWTLLGVAALLAGLALPAGGEAQNKPQPSAKKAGTPPAPKPGSPVALAHQRLEDANAIRQAFGLLAVANHD
jgi:hypothetical protein